MKLPGSGEDHQIAEFVYAVGESWVYSHTSSGLTKTGTEAHQTWRAVALLRDAMT
jgi:hypothetical protein